MDHWKIFYFQGLWGTKNHLLYIWSSAESEEYEGLWKYGNSCEFFMIRLILDLTPESKKTWYKVIKSFGFNGWFVSGFCVLSVPWPFVCRWSSHTEVIIKVNKVEVAISTMSDGFIMVLANLGPLSLHINFRISLSMYTKLLLGFWLELC